MIQLNKDSTQISTFQEDTAEVVFTPTVTSRYADSCDPC